jgi:hypothetical protein
VPDGVACTLTLDIELGGLLGARLAAAGARQSDRVRVATRIAITG